MVSTYGLVLIVDVDDEDGAQRVADAVLATLSRVFPEQLGVADDMDYEIEDTDSGARLLMNGQGVVAGNQEESFFVGAPAGRAVICEDGDEFGVTFSVWRLDPAGSECLYRVSVPYEDEDLEPEIAARISMRVRKDGPAGGCGATLLLGGVPGGR